MQAVGLQTYIWNNNLRSVLLLVGFPVLLLGMVFCLTLGMIWARHAASRLRLRRRRRPYALQLMSPPRRPAIVVAVVWFVIAYFFNQAIIDFATGSRPVDAATTSREPTTCWKTSASRAA